VTPAVAKPPYVGINTPAVAVTVPEDAPAPVVTDAKPAAKEAPKTVPLSQYNLSVYNEAVAELKALLANAQKYKDLSAANKALADTQQAQYDSAAQQFNRLIQFSPTFLSLDPAKYHWSMDKQDFVDAAGNSAAPIVKAEVKADPGK
jgi:tetratricopeptide (TPR) repeat protein